MDLVLTILESTAFAVLVSNVITMLIDDSKLKEAGPVTKAFIGLLNAVSLNVFGNKNVGNE